MPSPHLKHVFDPESLRKIATETERLRVELGAGIMAVRGLSGTLVASAMNVMFGTPFAVARKPNELSHGSAVELVDYYYDSEGFHDRRYENWLIVDDLIASGRTVREIYREVAVRDNIIRGECKGIVLYHSDYGRSFTMVVDAGPVVPVFYIGGEIQ